jgi:NAD(P)-dependent dehydrogenase (short-subunit alcohol dehydrogenase family)
VNGALEDLFSLEGRVAIVTGATGVLGGEMARGLARAGARISVLGRRGERAHPGREPRFAARLSPAAFERHERAKVKPGFVGRCTVCPAIESVPITLVNKD